MIARKLHFLFLFFLLLPLTACQKAPEAGKSEEPNHLVKVIDSFNIPVLATAEAQLAHARSDFDEVAEKIAALKAMTILHPDDRYHAALAALELAYLQLGPDYRLADDRQCRLAMAKYQAVHDDFIDFPELQAKALWYLGWIGCDLLGERSLGLASYRQLVREFGAEPLNFLPPAPWITIRLLEENPEHPISPPKKPWLSWGDLAHLEIIRYEAFHQQAWQSLLAIRANHGDDTFTGIGLKVFHSTHGFTAESLELTLRYLTHSTADQNAKGDLRLLVANHLRDGGKKEGQR